MGKPGMNPSITHNPDPTFSQAAANMKLVAMNRAKRVAAAIREVAEIAGYKVCGDIILRDEFNNAWCIKEGKKK